MSAQFITNPEKLETVLAKAEAALAPAMVKSADASASLSKADLKRDYIRAYCHRLRTTLAELDRSASVAAIEHARASCRELRTVFLELNPSATIPFRCIEPSCALLQVPRTAC